MELEFFCKPGEDLEWFEYWRGFCRDWLLSLGIDPERLRLRDHEKEELAFYSKATTDFEYKFPFGWGELWGVADRTDYDLKQHQDHSGQPMEYIDPRDERALHPLLHRALPGRGPRGAGLPLRRLRGGGPSPTPRATRTCAWCCTCTPCSRRSRRPSCPCRRTSWARGPATEIYDRLRKKFSVDYDETGSIGKRYRRQDEIGTPLCITVDFDTATDNCVTVRDPRQPCSRSASPVDKLEDYIAAKLVF